MDVHELSRADEGVFFARATHDSVHEATDRSVARGFIFDGACIGKTRDDESDQVLLPGAHGA